MPQKAILFLVGVQMGMLVDDDIFITKSERRISALTNDLMLSTY